MAVEPVDTTSVAAIGAPKYHALIRNLGVEVKAVLEELTITTREALEKRAGELVDADKSGAKRSIDTLDADKFRKITGGVI